MAGHNVALIEINVHTGGMVSGVLVTADMGDRKTVRGLADDFFVRLYRKKYGAGLPRGIAGEPC